MLPMLNSTLAMANSDNELMKDEDLIVVGSRKSQLALIQTNEVISILKKLHPSKKFDILSMSTTGDKILDKPLPKIGEKSLFTKELENALEQSEIQLVVHSMKDLPTSLPAGMAVGAVLKREDPRDAVVFNKNLKITNLSSLPPGSTIGTSSLRRVAQLHQNFPLLKVESIRGNLNTRFRKLDDDDVYSAIILAIAGLKRIGLESRISQVLEGSDMMYAVGQGALAVECREDDLKTLKMLEPLHHADTTIRVIAERSFLYTLGGGCSAPVAVLSEYITNSTTGEEKLELEGGVWSLDGKKILKKKDSCIIFGEEQTEDGPPRKSAHLESSIFCSILAPASIVKQCGIAFKLGQTLALSLLKDGAAAIMDEARRHNEER